MINLWYDGQTYVLIITETEIGQKQKCMISVL